MKGMLAGSLILTGALTMHAGPGLAQEMDEATAKMNAKSYYKGDPPISGRLPEQTGWLQIPTPPKEKEKKFEFSPPISAEAKMKAMQSLMYYNPFSLKQMINMMAAKKKAAKGLTFEEVVESLKVKGNELNMRFVGVSTPWKVIREIYDPEYPRVEIYSFCDLETLARILEYVPEFIVFIPCRIAVMEDKNGDIWLVTLDWDVRWMDTSPNPNRISDDLRRRAISVRERLEAMMEAAANGDF
jgi:uncharacterized protein (DUF302 family)